MGDNVGLVLGGATEDMVYTELSVATRMYILSLGMDSNTPELGDGGGAGKYGEGGPLGVSSIPAEANVQINTYRFQQEEHINKLESLLDFCEWFIFFAFLTRITEAPYSGTVVDSWATLPFVLVPSTGDSWCNSSDGGGSTKLTIVCLKKNQHSKAAT